MLKAQNISKAFETDPIIENVSLAVQPHMITTLLGPSGSGKTTLLRCLSMIEPPDSGTIVLGDLTYSFPEAALDLQRGMNRPWPKVTVVFQDLFLWPHMTNFENISRPCRRRFGRESGSIVEDLCSRLSLGPLLHRYPNEVSRGQRQVIALARAVALKPDYLLLDEISASLDLARAVRVADLLARLADGGMGVMVITHQLGFIRNISNCIAYLENGKIVEQGTTDILDSPMSSELRAYIDLVNKTL